MHMLLAILRARRPCTFKLPVVALADNYLITKSSTHAISHLYRSMTSEASQAQPRWQRIIEEALKEEKSANVYQFATVDSRDHSPRVRSLVHRAFLPNPTNHNPLLLTTTDIRSAKIAHIAHDARIELAWWFPKANAQLRIAGTVYVRPAPEITLTQGDAMRLGAQDAKAVERHVKTLSERFEAAWGGDGTKDWETERRERFDSMSGHMRASWATPAPGTALNVDEDAREWPETLPPLTDTDVNTETRTQVGRALNNFALVVIDPAEVVYLELGVTPNRRTRFYRDEEEAGKWKEEALVP